LRPKLWQKPMASLESAPHFPSEIQLATNPLTEAWLELQWRTRDADQLLEPIEQMDVDPAFAFSLGAFYNAVRGRYPQQEKLPAAQVPDSMLPHVPRYRFRAAAETWPLLQIGPGVAAVNFTKPYSWKLFRDEALFLLSALRSAYEGSPVTATKQVLRYQDLFPFDYERQNVLTYLGTMLNLPLQTPTYMPGPAGEQEWPRDVVLHLAYPLHTPDAVGTIRIATGTATKAEGDLQRAVVVELEVLARNLDSGAFADSQAFGEWLDAAHDVIHEWFFALIDGKLREQFERGAQV
jgi:uncharacterized protein (TIGR04255 family)